MPERAGRLLQASRPAMGSLFEIALFADDLEQGARLAEDALDRVDWLEAQLSHYLPDSDLSLLNAHAYAQPFPLAPNLWRLLLRLRRLSAETDNAFDPTCGKLIRAWGFYRKGALQGEAMTPPSQDEIRQIAQQIGWRHVELDESARTVRFLTPALELHLGGVGKGYIVQAAADYLRENGVASALLHCGQSSIVALGSPPERAGWEVVLPSGTVFALRDASCTVSMNRGHFLTAEGRRIGHTLDPRTGVPVATTGTVSVLAQDATDGDALATAFLVNGADWTQRYCAAHDSVQAFFLNDQEG